MNFLTEALTSGRFHHAWIFSGPRGVGKFTTALIVARHLLEPPTSPAQPNTRAINWAISQPPFSHPDLHVIRKELAAFSDSRELRERKQLNIPIDLLRERVIGGRVGDVIHDAPAYRTSLRGCGKVFIIDEAEMVEPIAQNALLKTLEEPPPQTYFFLITSQPERLLPTIRSRCQHVRFGTLDDESMKVAVGHWLAAVGSEPPAESGKPGAKSLAFLLRFADGSPGVAHVALQYGFYQWQKTLEPMLAELDRGKFPATMGATLGELVEEFAVAWVKAHGEKTTSKDAANKSGARHILALLASHLRNQLAWSIDRGEDPSPHLAAIELLDDAQTQLESNVNLKLLLENLVVQWAQQKALVHAAVPIRESP